MTPQVSLPVQVPASVDNRDLSAFFADPWSVFDTSGGDPRLHAYRRIALAAYALGWDCPQTCSRIGNVDGLPRASLETLADGLEAQVDSEVYG